MKWHERGLIMQKIQSENKYAPPMRSKKKIGNTTFIVNSFFPQTGNQTIASKLENLIKADVQKQTVDFQSQRNSLNGSRVSAASATRE